MLQPDASTVRVTAAVPPGGTTTAAVSSMLSRVYGVGEQGAAFAWVPSATALPVARATAHRTADLRVIGRIWTARMLGSPSDGMVRRVCPKYGYDGTTIFPSSECDRCHKARRVTFWLRGGAAHVEPVGPDRGEDQPDDVHRPGHHSPGNHEDLYDRRGRDRARAAQRCGEHDQDDGERRQVDDARDLDMSPLRGCYGR